MLGSFATEEAMHILYATVAYFLHKTVAKEPSLSTDEAYISTNEAYIVCKKAI